MSSINLYMDDQRLCPIGWELARTVEDAQRFLTAGVVNKCSLDHDMGACADCVAKGLHIGDMETPQTTFMNWCPHAMDGTKLCRWMVETGYWPFERPQVHSANPEGRMRMISLISQFFADPAHGPMFY